MSLSTDNVRPSPSPNVWRIHNLTIVGVAMGLVDLSLCVARLAVGKIALGLGNGSLQTLSVVALVFSGQAVIYVLRERQSTRKTWTGR